MSAPRSYDELLAAAVAVLTEAARYARRCTDPAGLEVAVRVDFGEFVTLAVAGAAANLGGIEEALAGRPGSWEADAVREMLHATVGADEVYLPEHRTEPLVITVAVDNLLTDLDVGLLYQRAADELDQRANAILASIDTGDGVLDCDRLTGDQQATLDELDQLRAALEAQRQHDWLAYGEALTSTALTVAGELLPGLAVPVQIEVRLDWQPDQDAVPPWGMAYTVWERARELTPLPGTNIPPRDYPTRPRLPEIEHAAGRDPLTRLLHAEQAQADAQLAGADQPADEHGDERGLR
jgi:hypothetical protein